MKIYHTSNYFGQPTSIPGAEKCAYITDNLMIDLDTGELQPEKWKGNLQSLSQNGLVLLNFEHGIWSQQSEKVSQAIRMILAYRPDVKIVPYSGGAWGFWTFDRQPQNIEPKKKENNERFENFGLTGTDIYGVAPEFYVQNWLAFGDHAGPENYTAYEQWHANYFEFVGQEIERLTMGTNVKCVPVVRFVSPIDPAGYFIREGLWQVILDSLRAFADEVIVWSSWEPLYSTPSRKGLIESLGCKRESKEDGNVGWGATFAGNPIDLDLLRQAIGYEETSNRSYWSHPWSPIVERRFAELGAL